MEDPVFLSDYDIVSMFIHANAERWSLDMNKYPAERGGRVYPRQLVQFSNEVMMALGTEILQQSAKGSEQRKDWPRLFPDTI